MGRVCSLGLHELLQTVKFFKNITGLVIPPHILKERNTGEFGGGGAQKVNWNVTPDSIWKNFLKLFKNNYRLALGSHRQWLTLACKKPLPRIPRINIHGDQLQITTEHRPVSPT